MLFDAYQLKNYTFKNRVVMPPMCMYSANDKGLVNDFHIIHYGTRAIGGVGLIIQEATAVLPDGRITVNDLGIWSDEHVEGLKHVVKTIKNYGAIAGIQVNHAGRKAKVERPVGPSKVAYSKDYQMPEEMTVNEIKDVVKAFGQAARRADEAGYDLLEIHGAHGYLIFQFLSPISNKRTDQYQDGKMFLREVMEEVVKYWPKEKMLALRVSAYEYVSEGVTPETISEAINFVKDLGLDMIDVSSGGNVLVKIKAYPGYQLELARKVKELTGLPVMGGGLITDLRMAELAVSSGKADFVYIGRELLSNPYLVINEAPKLGVELVYPEQYIRGKK